MNPRAPMVGGCGGGGCSELTECGRVFTERQKFTRCIRIQTTTAASAIMRINAIDDDININWSWSWWIWGWCYRCHSLSGAPIYANGNPASKYALYCVSPVTFAETVEMKINCSHLLLSLSLSLLWPPLSSSCTTSICCCVDRWTRQPH